ncbi:MAG: hypothetical protein ACYC6N_00240 [Pirellulaceae bacterium]
MSTSLPLYDNCVLRIDCPLTEPAEVLPPFAALPVFEPRRSVLVSWPLRVAQVADRVVARALPAGMGAGATGCGLTEITLAGLDRWCRLIPNHPEIVLAEKARLRIGQVIEEREDRYRRFQELRCAVQDHSSSFQGDSPCQLYLNPANCWIRWEGEAGSNEEEAFSDSVLFFLDGNELRGVRMHLEGQVLINELADYQPCTIAQWARLSTLVDAFQIVALVRHLVSIGLVIHI